MFFPLFVPAFRRFRFLIVGLAIGSEAYKTPPHLMTSRTYHSPVGEGAGVRLFISKAVFFLLVFSTRIATNEPRIFPHELDTNSFQHELPRIVFCCYFADFLVVFNKTMLTKRR